MTNQNKRQKYSRRDFLRLATFAGGGAVVLAAGTLANLDRLLGTDNTEPTASGAPAGSVVTQGNVIRLAATDGFISLPGRVDPLLVFGFIDVDPNMPINDIISTYKGKVQVSSPVIGVDEGDEVYLTLTNLGLVTRPDLDDSHTVHWHGFRNPIAYFDGVPEASIAVPLGRDFPYYYRPEHPGTYMYHCHFEDVEHVQMGMNGIVYVRPSQNLTGTGSYGPGKFAYNDGDGSTRYDREVTMMLNEIDTRPHDNLLNVQEFVWSDYKPNYWTINGRSYPDTIKGSNDPSLPSQPISSLVQCNPGERVLLRLANLGYEQHAMQLTGIPMKVVGHDATLLRSTSGADISYTTNSLLIGPGEARDAIFVAPAYDSSAVAGNDAGLGNYNRYYFKNRNYFSQTNDGLPGLGGMVTEVRVYEGSPLPPQSIPNETYL
ncbi:MAG: multicopper oxidase domain-containing protein [Ardenticatenaceae bacterium]|nr:multicopper oxidase domain-containing protein [Anaerolineales bacterium]MCB9009951.1 multicopper oxidase domain-containing protein [Ardenticatenaceae bacterium]